MFTPATSVQEFPASITLLTFTFPLLHLPVWSNATMLKTILYFPPPKSHRLSIESCENLQHMKEAVKWSSNRSKCWLQSLFLIQDFQILGFVVKKNDINYMKYGDF